MATAAGVLYMLNGTVILSMPLMNFDNYKPASTKVIV